MNKLSENKIVLQLEEWIRNGQGEKAKHVLLELKVSQIPRENVIPLANMARRMNLLSKSLQILRPIVRSEKPVFPPPSEEEWSLYAAGLIRIGALEEAKKILEPLDWKKNPQVLLFQSFLHVGEWDYKSTIPLLKRLKSIKKIGPYQRVVAKVNLAAAYVFEMNHKEGEEVLKEILKETESFKLLRGNVYELLAQVSIIKGDYIRARKFLDKATLELSQSKGLYEYFVRKWIAVLNLLENPESQKCQKALMAIREESFLWSNPETARECDLYQMSTAKDKELYIYLAMGTPFKSYRKRLVGFLDDPPKLTSFYDWTLPPFKKEESNRIFDMEMGEELHAKVKLKPGQKLHKLFKILSSDFYRPFRMGELFSVLYPSEYFNILSSPKRLERLIFRLKKWFVTNNIPLTVEVKAGEYRLVAKGPYTIRVYVERSDLSRFEHFLKELKLAFPYKSFSTKSASQALEVSQSTALRLMEWAYENKKILRTGQGRGRLYGFKK